VGKAESSDNGLLSLPGAIRLSDSSHYLGEVAIGDHAEWTLTVAHGAKRDRIVSLKIINSVNGCRPGGYSLAEPPALPFINPPQGTDV
jgi:hypothetical protein